jgi:hypothetical protein
VNRTVQRILRLELPNRVTRRWPGVLWLACLFILIAAGPGVAQAGVNVSAEVDRHTLSIDEQLTLTVTVAGSFDQISDPQLPALSGFRVLGSSRSSQFSMVNGVVTSRILFIFRLQPTQAGTLILPPATIQVNGASYRTEPISIEVTSGTLPSATSPSAATGAAPSSGPDLFVEAGVDNRTPFLGQQITYRFRFFQATTVFRQPELQWPDFSGFWAETLTPDDVYQQTIDGRDYRVTQVRQALFPTAVGELGIQATTLKIPGSVFDDNKVLVTDPITVNVQPLPEGAPAFDGAVGQYRISATLEPQTVGTNEPVTLRVRLWGTGNISALSDPAEQLLQDLADWRVYQAQVNTNVNREGSAIQGEKLFERLLVPKLAGDLELPAISFVFFDPQAAAYQQIETEPFKIHVTSDGAASLSPTAGPFEGNGDIRHIKPAPRELATRRSSIFQQPVYWLGWALPFAVLAGVWSWQRRRERRGANPARDRSKNAYLVARRRLKQARMQAVQGQESSYATVSKAMTRFVGDKLNLPTSRLTRDTIREKLTDCGVAGTHIDRFLACLEWADSGRFAPVATGKGPSALVTAAEGAIQQLERSWNEREPGGPPGLG